MAMELLKVSGTVSGAVPPNQLAGPYSKSKIFFLSKEGDLLHHCEKTNEPPLMQKEQCQYLTSVAQRAASAGRSGEFRIIDTPMGKQEAYVLWDSSLQLVVGAMIRCF